MIAVLLIGTALLAVQSSSTPSSTEVAPEDRAAYVAARDRAGLDADANVRLALWCEAHGLPAERAQHLARAVLSNPSNPAARGLLGMVNYGGQWNHPDEVAAKAETDQRQQAIFAEYNARREAKPDTAEGNWYLGLWCEEKGLKPEAIAHFAAVTRIDPNRADAWERLGCRKVGNRWLSEAEIADEQAQAEARRKDDAYWGVRVGQWWRQWLADKGHRAEVQEAFAAELRPGAVPTIRTMFTRGTIEQQLVAVGLYNRIDSPEAIRGLTEFATLDRHPEVRAQAVEALIRRDPTEVVEPLIALMRTPFQVEIATGPGVNPVKRVQIEDDRTILRKYYVPTVDRGGSRPSSLGFLTPVLRSRRISRRSVDDQIAIDSSRINRVNAVRQGLNESARDILVAVTGQDRGPDPDSWRSWLANQKGYAYVSPTPTEKRRYTRVGYYSGYHHNCFAKGTPVRTLLGSKPIETLHVGDQVLSENTTSGALSYQPVVAVFHNPPNPTVRIKVEGEEIVATPIHRFWRVGKGWALARDLKSGDQIRVLGGLARVVSVEDEAVQPVFNLEVAQGHTFFVGRQGALVHDNSALVATAQPFDAPPILAVAQEPPHKDRGGESTAPKAGLLRPS
jgi:hypothetical protein